jgi:dipeptide/tripeptide permease
MIFGCTLALAGFVLLLKERKRADAERRAWVYLAAVALLLGGVFLALGFGELLIDALGLSRFLENNS